MAEKNKTEVPAKENGSKLQSSGLDEMMLEMIAPKIREIEERFSRGEALTNEDINTLLIKAQFNHINHLDSRLNDVTASVMKLEERFLVLEDKFLLLEDKFLLLEEKFNHFRTEMESKFELLRMEVIGRLDLFEAKQEAFEKRIELKISEAINSNMRWSIGLITLIVVVLKLVDMLMPLLAQSLR